MARDYYAILGVLPSAEDIVVRAAYKALAQRHHPDKWAGENAEAERRMQEINQAYAILSDAAQRNAYDAQRKAGGGGEEFDTEEEGVRDAFSEAEEATQDDWDVAVEYFPDLENIYRWLKRTSSSLAFSYKTILLESKNFNVRVQLAESLETRFLETYFGTDPAVIAFAKRLIAGGEKAGARELNRAVSVLGSAVDAHVIISRIENKYPDGPNASSRFSRTAVELASSLDRHRTFGIAQMLMAEIGGSVKGTYRNNAVGMSVFDCYDATLWGQEHRFADEDDFLTWVQKEVIPAILGR